MNYRITIYNSRIYKEVIINSESFRELSIGTGEECQVALVQGDYKTDFKLLVKRSKDTFSISCDKEVYIRGKEDAREDIHEFEPGDSIVVRYSDSDEDVIFIDFMIDFGVIQDNYNLSILIPEGRNVSVGGASGSDIFINDSNLSGKTALLSRRDSGWLLDTGTLSFGVMVNGFLHKEAEVALKDSDFICINGYFFYLEKGKVYTTDSGKVTTTLSSSLIELSENHLKYPKFIRSVRQQYEDPDDNINVLPPQTAPAKPKKNLLLSLIPSLTMLFAMILLRGMMGGRSMLYGLYFAITMGIGIVTSVITYFSSKKEYRKQMVERVEKYNKYLDDKENEIMEARDNEKNIFRRRYYSVEEEITFIERFDSRLFDKSTADKDFLDVYIGRGRVESVCPIKYNAQEFVSLDDPMMEYPEKVHDKYRFIDDMPVVLHLAGINAAGVIGVRSKLYQMAKNLLISVCSGYFWNDVKVFMVMDEIDAPDFSWIRWFRHLTSENSRMRNLIYDDQSRKSGLGFLYEELSTRDSMDETTLRSLPYYVVFLYRTDKIMNHPVMKYVAKAEKLHFSFIFFEEYEEMLNKDCDIKIYLEPQDNRGYIQKAKDGRTVQSFVYSHVDRKTAEMCALRLGCVYVDEISLESTLTKNITLYKLLGIMNAYDLDLASRWKQSKVYESMAAPIGVKSDGSILSLDLHERYHGPHGLVAGTTGSGKSELLQSYVLSMATLFHPYEVSFIIIDFKGGGMANQFRDLPHLNAAITNIDGKQIDRSLISIKAELLRRQELFAKHDVNRIDDYIKLFREGKTDIPLPHLILIVDEFAELKSDQPEFMKELISAARIGRSLGVHLILATQKPAGVVNDQIWSNSRFKLCLKVQDQNDSKEVLKSPLAAEIKEPGRAYLQVGNNEIFELFQSAYSGAPTHVGDTESKRAFEIDAVSLSGMRMPVYKQRPEKAEGDETELDAIVNYINVYCEKKNIKKLPGICLPPLEELIPYPERMETEGTDIIVPIGIYDDPSHQEQKELSVNLSQNHVFILGSSLSGKTYLIQSMIYGLVSKYSPEDVNIYIMDFASMILRSFEGLGHVGAVVTINEDDKLKNMLQFFSKMIEERRQILAKIGLSSYSAYREAGYRELPQIVLFLDNLTAFRTAFQEHEDEFINICRDGVAVGLSIVATNQQMAGTGYRLLTNFAVRIALHCNEKTQYSGLFDSPSLQPDDHPGRGIISLDNNLREFQSYIAFSMGKEVERNSAIKDFIEKTNSRYRGKKISAIASVPDKITDEFIMSVFDEKPLYDNRLLVGVGYKDTKPVFVNMAENPLMGICGSDEMGRIGYIRYLINEYADNSDNSPVRLYIADDPDAALRFSESLDITTEYSSSVSDIVDMLEKVHGIAESRYEKWKNDSTALDDEPLVILLLNSKMSADVLVSTDETATQFSSIVREYAKCRVCILIANAENKMGSSYGSGQILSALRDSGNLLIFENIGDIKILNIPMASVRAFKKANGAGDAFYLRGNDLIKLKTPLM